MTDQPTTPVAKPKRNGGHARNQRTHLTPDELTSVLQVAKDASLRDFTILLVIYKHALRSQEACNLRLADILPSIPKMQELHVARLKGSLVTDQPINDCPGAPLLSEKRALREWIAARPANGSDRLFVGQKGNLSRETVSRMFLHYCKLASEKRVADATAKGVQNPETFAIPESAWYVHALKHSRMQHLVGKTDLYNLKSIAGHRAISSTMVYLSPDQRQAVSEAHRIDMTIF